MRVGPLVIIVQETLSFDISSIQSNEAKSIFDVGVEMASSCNRQGWLGCVGNSLKAGCMLSLLIEDITEIPGGKYLVDHIWEAGGLMRQSPSEALEITNWCYSHEVRDLIADLFWVRENWYKIEDGVSQRNLMALNRMLVALEDALGERDTHNAMVRMRNFKRKLLELGFEIPENCLLLISIIIIRRAGIRGIRVIGESLW